MIPMKSILQGFVGWLELAYGNAERGAASEFAIEPPPGALAVAQVALDAAVNSEQPVVLGTSVPVKAVIAALVLRRAGVTLEEVFQGSLTDGQFTALADALRALRMSGLMVEMPDHQPKIET
jgi:hypothetical protein